MPDPPDPTARHVYRARRAPAVIGSLAIIAFGSWALVSGPVAAALVAGLALAAAPVFVVMALRTRIAISPAVIAVRDLRNDRSFARNEVDITVQRLAGGWLRSGPVLVFTTDGGDPTTLALASFSTADRAAILAELSLGRGHAAGPST